MKIWARNTLLLGPLCASLLSFPMESSEPKPLSQSVLFLPTQKKIDVLEGYLKKALFYQPIKPKRRIRVPYQKLAQAEKLTQNLEQDFFQKAFGKPKKTQKLLFLAPFQINNRGESKTMIKKEENTLFFQGHLFLQQVQPLLAPEQYQKLEQIQQDDNFIKLDALNDLGYKAWLDESVLILKIHVPPEFRRHQSSSLRSTIQVDEKTIIEPADFAAYLNYYLSESYYKNETEIGWSALRARYENVCSYHNWVLENNLSMNNSSSGRKVSHTMQRLSYDFEDYMLRFMMGDLTFSSRNFRSLPSYGGIGVRKQFSIQPNFDKSSTQTQDFFLENPSKVEVYVNGNRTKTLDLEPGYHTLADFSREAGSNTGSLKIKDEFGKVQWINFSFFYDTELLGEGIHDFGYFLAYPRRLSNGNIRYQMAEPLVDVEHYYGYSDTHTAGVYMQRNYQQGLTGMHHIFSIWKGRLSIDGAYSDHRYFPCGIASSVRYSHYHKNQDKQSYQGSWSVGATYRGKNFMRIGALQPNNPYSWQLAVSASRKFAEKLQGGVYATMDFARENQPNPIFIGFGLDYNLRKSFDISTQLQLRKDPGGVKDWGIIFNLNWVLPEKLSQGSFSYNTLRVEKNYTYSYNNSRLPVISDWDVFISSTPKDQTATFNYNRGNELYQGGINYDNIKTFDGAQVAHNVDLSLSSCLVLVDGEMAISRPITNSFAIFVPNQKIQNWEVFVNPTQSDYLAKSFYFNPAVVVSLPAYQPKRFYIDAPDLPIGYSIGRTNYSIKPRNKSGFIIPVGEDASVMLQVDLTDSDQEPLSLVAGKIVFLADKDKEPVTFFTNKKGRIRVLGLNPGRYRIVLFSPDYQPTEFEIPEKVSGLYRMPALTISGKKSK